MNKQFKKQLKGMLWIIPVFFVTALITEFLSSPLKFVVAAIGFGIGLIIFSELVMKTSDKYI